MPMTVYAVEADSWVPQAALPYGLLSGDGVFTTLAASPGQPVFCLERHYERLRRDCGAFGLACPWSSPEAFEAALTRFVNAHMTTPQVVRVTLAANTAGLEDSVDPIPVWPFFTVRPLPAQKTALTLDVHQFDRPFPRHKHTSLLVDRVHLYQARAQGWDDVLRVSQAGYLAETTMANIFLVKPDDTLLTPDPHMCGCLPGIMREAVLDACAQAHIPVSQGAYPADVITGLKGVFVTNAVRGLVPVGRVGNAVYDTAALEPVLALVKRHLPTQNSFLPWS